MGFFSGIVNAVSTAISRAVSFVTGAVNAAEKAVESCNIKDVNSALNAVDKALDAVEKAQEALKKKLEKLKQKITTGAEGSGAIPSVTGFIEGLAAGMLDGVEKDLDIAMATTECIKTGVEFVENPEAMLAAFNQGIAKPFAKNVLGIKEDSYLYHGLKYIGIRAESTAATAVNIGKGVVDGLEFVAKVGVDEVKYIANGNNENGKVLDKDWEMVKSAGGAIWQDIKNTADVHKLNNFIFDSNMSLHDAIDYEQSAVNTALIIIPVVDGVSTVAKVGASTTKTVGSAMRDATEALANERKPKLAFEGGDGSSLFKNLDESVPKKNDTQIKYNEAVNGSSNSNLDNFNSQTATNKQKGNFGEIKADDNLLNDQSIKDAGYDLKSVGRNAPSGLDDKIVKGIDGLYENTGANSNVKYVIDEAKFGSSQLGITKDGLQMSDDWLKGSDRILKAVNGDKDLAYEIKDALDNGQVERVLSKIDSDGNVATYKIDSNGKVIGIWP